MVKERWIPPQGLEESWRGIMPPQGVRGIVAIRPPSAPPEEEAIWLAGWSFRKLHEADGTTDGAQTDFQMEITVHKGVGVDAGKDIYCNNHCEDDFKDIRFTKSDRVTVLPQWRKSFVSGDEAHFWLPVDDIPADPDSGTIYIYYGNSGASLYSDFDDTFIFGTPFDNAVLDAVRWPTVDGNPIYSIDTINHYLEITDMDWEWNNSKGFHGKTIAFPSQYIIEDAYSSSGVYTSWHTTNNNEQGHLNFNIHHEAWTWGDLGVAFWYVSDAWQGNKNVEDRAGVGGNSDYYKAGRGVGQPYVNYIRIWKLAGDIHVEEDTAERVSEANAETPDRVCLGIGSGQFIFNHIRFGAFKVRKYADPEPTHGLWGAEETP